MALPIPPSLITTTSVKSPEPTSHHGRKHRRVFIGPMLEKVISRTEAQVRKSKNKPLFPSSDSPSDDNMSQIMKNNAFSFFIREGGKVEDWGENEERSAVEEMLKRWRNSEWGAIWSGRKKQSRQTSRWVGGSFEIGDLLGVNILEEPTESIRDRISNRSSRKTSSSPSQTQVQTEEVSLATGIETFDTARTEPGPSISADPQYYSTSQNNHILTSPDAEGQMPGSATSSTALLRPSSGPRHDISQGEALSEVLRPPVAMMPSTVTVTKSDGPGNINLQAKGKGKLVHYADSPSASPEAPGPAPPSEVLERTGSAVAGTSSAATVTTDPSMEWGEVVMRGIWNSIHFFVSCQ